MGGLPLILGSSILIPRLKNVVHTGHRMIPNMAIMILGILKLILTRIQLIHRITFLILGQQQLIHVGA